VRKPQVVVDHVCVCVCVNHILLSHLITKQRHVTVWGTVAISKDEESVTAKLTNTIHTQTHTSMASHTDLSTFPLRWREWLRLLLVWFVSFMNTDL